MYKILLARQRRNSRIYKKISKFFASKKFEGIMIRSATIALLFIFSFGVSGIIPTNAYFNDTESSTGNTFTAGTLDISLDNTNTYSSSLMYPSDATTTTISISNAGSLDSQYIASTTIMDNEASVCDYVTMTATGPDNSFTGLIKNFISNATSTTNAVWNYSFTISPTAPPSVWGKTCFFKWTYTAWQDNLPNSFSGFSSVKEKLGSVRIGKAIVLNEVLADPAGSDTAAKPGGEWVELYNNSNISFDLDGWYIYDSTDDGEVPVDVSHTISGTSIASHSFLVVYRNGDDDFNLNNNADSIRLFTKRISAGGILVDSYSWTMEKPEGFSYARIPDGIGAWVDPIPTPGWTNDFSEIFEEILGTTTEKIISLATITAEMATTTMEIILENGSSSSTTAEIIATTTDFDIVASTTPETASTTPEIITEIASTTPAIIESEPVVIPPEPEVILTPSPDQGVSLGLGTQAQEGGVLVPEVEDEVVVAEPVIEPEVIVEPVVAEPVVTE